MKKLITALFVGLFGASFALAEESGWFIGAQGSISQHKNDVELVGWSILGKGGFDDTSTSIRAGFLGGYKLFFTEDFGARFYGKVQTGNGIQNADLNADALYNFGEVFGIFAGLSFGQFYYDEASGIDVGVNLGTKWALGERHALEAALRLGFMEQEETIISSYKYKESQPWELGIRYVFSF